MQRNLGLSSPVHEIPMDDTTLIIIGRIAIIWGQINFHLDHVLMELMGTRTVENLRDYPLRSLKRKLTDLWRELSRPENIENRPLLTRIHAAIDGLASDRNVIFHGLWGYEWDPTAVCWKIMSKSYTRDDPFYVDDLREFHERLVTASEAVSDAWWILLVGKGEPPRERNRRQIWGDGRPPQLGGPLPPRRSIR